MKSVTPIRTLIYYDGVQLFEGHDEDGAVCVGVALPPQETFERFLIVAVRAERLESFVRGDMDLRSLILDTANFAWGIALVKGDEQKFIVQPQQGRLADFAFLPEPGFFLPERPESEQENRPAVSPHHATELFKMALRAGSSPEKAFAETRRVHGAVEAEIAQKNAKAEIHRIYILRDPPIIADEMIEWYAGPHPDDHYWPGLVSYLRGIRKWDEKAIAELDRASTQVLSRVAPPGMPEINTRGLVVGYVQSGKTANFTAVMAKAADIDYRLFVVLSGLTNSLRNQTQQRLEAELVATSPAGWLTLTSVENDFSRSYPAKADNVLNQNRETRVLAVIKKNGNRLRRFIEWLEGAHIDTRRRCAMVIIDDEADQASINTSRNEAERSKINALLVRLLKLMPKAAYIGYTATPFANVLNEAPGPESLYPSNFIVTLPRPSTYFGPERVFGRERLRTEEESAEVDGLDMIRTIAKNEAVVLHEAADAGLAEVPASLDVSIRYFLMATAARLVREKEIEFSTMMVHTTQRVSGHRVMNDAILSHINKLKLRIGVDVAIAAELEEQWNLELDRVAAAEAGCERAPVSFAELAPLLPKVVSDVEMVIDNYVSPARLDFSRRGRILIVVGGNTLARGLTVEGLVTSYFIRTSTAYDTLMQMGRWFGYRKGYEDLPRIWMTDELRDYFFDLATIEEEFRAEVRRYTLGLTPRQFGPKIRTHPALMITSRLKMQAAIDVDVSYGGLRCQTILFHHRDATWLDRNIGAAKQLVAEAAVTASKVEGPADGRLRLLNVPAAAIFTFLEAYAFHPQSRELKKDLLVRYIRAQNHVKALEFWNVVVAGQADAEVLGAWDTGKGMVGLINRSRMKSAGPDRMITANIKSLMSKSDLVADIDAGPDYSNKTHDELLRIRSELLPLHGLIVLYPISKDSVPRRINDKENQHRENLDAVNTVMGVAVVLPEPKVDTPQAYRTVDMSQVPREEAELPEDEQEDAA
jgi:hypothetical protein